ncbi:single-stranded DNA-binding protein [Babesia caballi]|uniref:Single-stranded DNA-binding protein n=1 Tax=Babesia caballi TaxID=5871 RepID=A0AAV4LYS0_BABCB|nr:single-stranded DNA-binding protein [Babesia caballi]
MGESGHVARLLHQRVRDELQRVGHAPEGRGVQGGILVPRWRRRVARHRGAPDHGGQGRDPVEEDIDAPNGGKATQHFVERGRQLAVLDEGEVVDEGEALGVQRRGVDARVEPLDVGLVNSFLTACPTTRRLTHRDILVLEEAELVDFQVAHEQVALGCAALQSLLPDELVLLHLAGPDVGEALEVLHAEGRAEGLEGVVVVEDVAHAQHRVEVVAGQQVDAAEEPAGELPMVLQGLVLADAAEEALHVLAALRGFAPAGQGLVGGEDLVGDFDDGGHVEVVVGVEQQVAV